MSTATLQPFRPCTQSKSTERKDKTDAEIHAHVAQTASFRTTHQCLPPPIAKGRYHTNIRIVLPTLLSHRYMLPRLRCVTSSYRHLAPTAAPLRSALLAPRCYSMATVAPPPHTTPATNATHQAGRLELKPLEGVEAAKRAAAYASVDNHIKPEHKIIGIGSGECSRAAGCQWQGMVTRSASLTRRESRLHSPFLFARLHGTIRSGTYRSARPKGQPAQVVHSHGIPEQRAHRKGGSATGRRRLFPRH